jgi:uncharacterized protein YraI
VSAEILGAVPMDAPVMDSAPTARTVGTLNLRSGPGQSYSRLGTLARNTALVLEARSADSTWLLVHTLDNTLRGWVFAAYLETNVTLADLPISEEGATTENPGAPTNDFLNTVPVIPSPGPRAREIYMQGNANPRVFSKVGDCNSADWLFLSPFDVGSVDLGENSGLLDSISFFRGSFSQSSAAAHVGFNAMTVIDASWANPQMCSAGESSVWCEYRLRHPAVSLIMFGANDVYNLSVEQYDQSLRQIVDWTIQAGAIPVLGTFAWCGTGQFADKAVQLNTLTVNIAYEYGVPVINFWRAAQSLPNCGLASDGIHLSEAGFSLRNLITLQTLDEVRRNALY